jgi:protein-arginine kinase activator protein McsA
VIWVNGEWEMEIPETDEKGNEILDGESTFVPILESMLEVYFSPMTVISKETVVDEEEIEDKPEGIDLNKQLEKALNDENYELASKIRDLIDIYKKQK